MVSTELGCRRSPYGQGKVVVPNWYPHMNRKPWLLSSSPFGCNHSKEVYQKKMGMRSIAMVSMDPISPNRCRKNINIYPLVNVYITMENHHF
jgi:hypothetical protein